MTKEKASNYHSRDLSRRLKKWAENLKSDPANSHVTKHEIESYLAQFSAQNFINRRAALSNLFGYTLKIGATSEEPTFQH